MNKNPEYNAGYDDAVNDVAEGWFDPADYNRDALVNHLVMCDDYSADYLEGYCDGAFAPDSLPLSLTS